MRMEAGVAISCRQAIAWLATPVASTVLMVAVYIAQPAFSADLDYGPYGPQPYTYQRPPYDDGAAVYPPHRYVPPRQGASSQHRYTYQSPPYDYGEPAYPSRRYGSSPHGIYDEDPYEYETHEYRAPAYPSYRSVPFSYDLGPRGNRYRPYGYANQYADQYYDSHRGPAIELEPLRPPAPIMGSRRGSWVAHPSEFPGDSTVEAVPPNYAWPADPPRRW
jgi:hypothetical protein